MSSWKAVPIHVIDFEGSVRTGIIEYGVVTLHRGEIIAAATRLCASRTAVPCFETQCHGLRDSDLAGTLPLSSDWDLFSGFRRAGFLCAHHASTEHGLLKSVWPYPGMMPDHARPGDGLAVNDWGPWVDTCRLASQWHPRLADYSLGTLVEWFCLGRKLAQLAQVYCPADRRHYHCALYDALGSALLLRHMCAQPDRGDVSLELLVRESLSGPRHAERIQGELELW